jgi:WD40 repeat protein
MQFLRGHSGRVRSLAFAPGGRMLATGGGEGLLRLWDLDRGRERAVLRYRHRNVNALAFAPDGRTLATTGVARDVALLDMVNLRHRIVLRGHQEPVRSLAFSPDGATLVSGGGLQSARAPTIGEVITWDSASGDPRVRLVVSGGRVLSVAFAPDGKEVALSTGDAIAFWDPALPDPASGPGRAWLELAAPAFGTLPDPPPSVRGPWPLEGDAWSVAFAPDGTRLAAAAGACVSLWDPRSFGRVGTLEGHQGEVRAVAFAPGGRLLASASRDRTVRFWDVSAGAQRACFDWEIGPVNAVAFAPDGMTIAAGGESVVVIWDVDETFA